MSRIGKYVVTVVETATREIEYVLTAETEEEAVEEVMAGGVEPFHIADWNDDGWEQEIIHAEEITEDE